MTSNCSWKNLYSIHHLMQPRKLCMWLLCTIIDASIMPLLTSSLSHPIPHGLHLHLSPISFHLFWVPVKAGHDKNRLYFEICDSKTQDMIKIQGKWHSSVLALTSICGAELVPICRKKFGFSKAK